MNILFLTPRNSEKYLGWVEGHVRILRGELIKRGYKVKELSLDFALRLPRGIKDAPRKDKINIYKGRASEFKLRAWGYLWRNRNLFKWADVVHVRNNRS